MRGTRRVAAGLVAGVLLLSPVACTDDEGAGLEDEESEMGEEEEDD